ncbi:WecB/TagA/CpsF family glycosyltransferase [Candidatus Collierbacteria bacterium]|nr:WecB/TagA/CpsF family glycosyltransferase [Candidatus Collierbacteria bacterium]
MVKKRVLGTRVDLVSQSEAVDMVSGWIDSSDKKTRLVATAYSEFFVAALGDKAFRMALEGSDLVTPDGIGPLAAISYQLAAARQTTVAGKFLVGLQTGVDILRGRVGQPVSGYWLFETLVAKAADEGWSVFLLGGFGETAEKLAAELSIKYKVLSIKYEGGARNEAEMTGEANEAVIEKINRFKPDLLFVAYGPVKQEKWLAENKGKLRVKVAMGVGGTFDEVLGLVKPAPVFMTRIGLKWFWRLLQQPQRLPRIFKATIVFAWLVFVDSLKNKNLRN